MEESEIVKLFDEVNNSFVEFIEILPFIELQDGESFTGEHIKLRVQLPNDSTETFSTMSMIYTELQYMLHRHNNRMDLIPATKMIVSELILTPIIPDAAFRRGFIIKILYVKK